MHAYLLYHRLIYWGKVVKGRISPLFPFYIVLLKKVISKMKNIIVNYKYFPSFYYL